jgi:hypothetical protein
MKAARCRISGMGELLNEWNKSSGRRTGGLADSFGGAGEVEPKSFDLSSVGFVCWPKSEKARLFEPTLDCGRFGPEFRDTTTLEKDLESCGFKDCEHLRQMFKADDRANGSIFK